MGLFMNEKHLEWSDLLLFLGFRHLARNKSKRLRKVGSTYPAPLVNKMQMHNFTKVSRCRPDLQFSWAVGNRQQLEEMSVSSSRRQERIKAAAMLTLDLRASYILK